MQQSDLSSRALARPGKPPVPATAASRNDMGRAGWDRGQQNGVDCLRVEKQNPRRTPLQPSDGKARRKGAGVARVGVS